MATTTLQYVDIPDISSDLITGAGHSQLTLTSTEFINHDPGNSITCS